MDITYYSDNIYSIIFEIHCCGWFYYYSTYDTITDTWYRIRAYGNNRAIPAIRGISNAVFHGNAFYYEFMIAHSSFDTGTRQNIKLLPSTKLGSSI